jgi:hypothetical protein
MQRGDETAARASNNATTTRSGRGHRGARKHRKTAIYVALPDGIPPFLLHWFTISGGTSS